MIIAYFTNISDLPDDKELATRLLGNVDAVMQRKVLTYQNQREQFLRLLGRHLLHKLLFRYHLNDRLSIKSLGYSDFGKPYFTNPDNDFDFSIAHSGNIVVCAGVNNNSKIGVDIEKNEFRDVEVMQEYFTDNEWRIIQTVDAKQEYLHKFWVRKEACIKAMGKGLFLPLHEIDVSGSEILLEGTVLHLYDLPLMKGYSGCIASSDVDGVAVSEVGIETLIDQQ